MSRGGTGWATGEYNAALAAVYDAGAHGSAPPSLCPVNHAIANGLPEGSLTATIASLVGSDTTSHPRVQRCLVALLSEEYTASHLTCKGDHKEWEQAWVLLERMASLRHVRLAQYTQLLGHRSARGFVQATVDLRHQAQEAVVREPVVAVVGVSPISWRMATSGAPVTCDPAVLASFLSACDKRLGSDDGVPDVSPRTREEMMRDQPAVCGWDFLD
ncbi:hypothetical protein CYMTET_32409 [Cymbomonas tetramitiformis]|uniref:Uncharacterized protein n=1 Tax=Cymbomonas tetramitiformis TaxID=36881 RepID=A0AAE0FF39_9CHLO|nr:hypothetical protein CYMTET_32405 [Cymbomonas tetramitiformis]KAK3258550.1 hypothetical protein CYMTET_32409 [Cymbomonas tetramitiformis]